MIDIFLSLSDKSSMFTNAEDNFLTKMTFVRLISGLHIPEIFVKLKVPQFPKSEFSLRCTCPSSPKKHITSTTRARTFLCFQYFGEHV